MNDLTLSAIFSRLAAYLIFCAVHGAIIAATLRYVGQEKVAAAGRLTASPFPNLSLLGLVMAVIFRVSWIRPFTPDPQNVKKARSTLVLAVILSLAVTAIMVPLIDPLRVLAAQGLPRTAGYAVLQVLVALQDIAKASVLLNVLPLPGLTGGLLLYAFFPQWSRRLNRYAVVVPVLITIALIVGILPIDAIRSMIP